jgi:lauroyl/myristoyl acyltransferase
MTRAITALARPRITPGMFHTSSRVSALERVLRPLPGPVSEAVLATAAIADGLVHATRFRRARAWAAAQPGVGQPPWRLVLALLANHGRFCAEEAFLGVSRLEDVRRRVVLEGREHLSAAGGAILLGFHLGSPQAWFRLRALGYPVRFAGRLERKAGDPRWAEALQAREVIRLPEGSPQERMRGLYHIRDLLRDGAMVFLTADGPFGREAFRIDLPGGPLVVRRGWLALRSLTRVPTLPVLAHRDGRHHIIVVHPALPPPAVDLARDAAQCRAALTPLIESYVRRFPAQCRYLALPPWPASPDDETIGALDSEGRAT